MIKKYTFIVLSAILMSLATAAEILAHPGHGTTEGSSLIHFISEPIHILSFVAFVAVGIGITLWYRARKKKLVRVDA